jgi:nitronate monooxygenase
VSVTRVRCVDWGACVAAGGTADSRSLAAVLAPGAQGAWIGTALLATEEATEIPDSYKRRIVSSDGQGTVFTTLYDTLFDASSQLVFAPASPQTASPRIERAGGELRECRNEVLPTVSPRPLRRHDPVIDPTWMGQSAGTVNSVRTVAEVLRDLSDNAERLLRERRSALLY